jgi:hypothetical protein
MADPRHLVSLRSLALVTAFRRLLRDAFDPYRPEVHYMRGPGPKWRANPGVPEPRATPLIATSLPALR